MVKKKVTQKEMDIYMSPSIDEILSKKLIDNFGVITNFGIHKNIITIQLKTQILKQILMEDLRALSQNMLL